MIEEKNFSEIKRVHHNIDLILGSIEAITVLRENNVDVTTNFSGASDKDEIIQFTALDINSQNRIFDLMEDLFIEQLKLDCERIALRC